MNKQKSSGSQNKQSGEDSGSRSGEMEGKNAKRKEVEVSAKPAAGKSTAKQKRKS